ncbi:MAG TPA: glycosyltransferase [Gemmatimonadaceae bacterium]|nr:glycosyltransferase [Gemmatimonadaceae bacterium]
MSVIAVLAVAQVAALLVLLGRLRGGRRRAPPVEPLPAGLTDTTVSVLLPTLNEGHRIAPCLDGLHRQGPPLSEVIVIDSGSTDDTRAQVDAMRARDGRFRLIDDRPLPPGWIGKVWALERGRAHATGEWLLGVDADTEPLPGLVAGVVAAARRDRLDVVSFSPRFADMTPAEQWVQPALLTTLTYRTGAAGGQGTAPDRVLANGQCFLARRAVLDAGGGYAPARSSFSDDVTLARYYAAQGYRVGFLDGSRLYRVRSYESLGQMWREWGRSIDLRDSTTPGRLALDVALLTLVQAAPLPCLVALALDGSDGRPGVIAAASIVNGLLLLIRVLMLLALRHSYDRAGLTFWLSPLADPLAVLRVAVSAVRRPTRWRGRAYPVPASE